MRGLFTALGIDIPASGLTIEPNAVLIPILVGLLITVASAFFPARKAGKVAPIAAMREVVIDRPSRLGIRLVFGALFVGVTLLLVRQGLEADDQLAVAWVLGASIPAFLVVFSLGPFLARPLARRSARRSRSWGSPDGSPRRTPLRNPTRTATTAVALTIGVGLISVIAVAGESLSVSVDRAIDQGVEADFVVTAQSFFGVSPELAGELAADPNVAVATGVRFENLEIDGSRAFVGAIDPESVLQVIDLDVREGEIEGLPDDGPAISAVVAEREGWRSATSSRCASWAARTKRSVEAVFGRRRSSAAAGSS